MKLVSQFRCNGSDGCIAFLDDVLQMRKTANYTLEGINYDFRIFDSAVEVREALRPYNTNNKARMIAGYCYPWVSDSDKSKMDIVLPDGFQAQWNFKMNEFAASHGGYQSNKKHCYYKGNNYDSSGLYKYDIHGNGMASPDVRIWFILALFRLKALATNDQI